MLYFTEYQSRKYFSAMLCQSVLQIDAKMGCRFIIWKINIRNRGLDLENTLCTWCRWGSRCHTKPFRRSQILFITLTKYRKAALRAFCSLGGMVGLGICATSPKFDTMIDSDKYMTFNKIVIITFKKE